ncbi:MAG: TIGR03545 family protein [Bdellovibrionales bacterium]
MTNSTEATKKPKAKGPLRLEAIIPTLVLVVLVGVYFKLFFDEHLRRTIEWVGTTVNGAEVNVGHVSTSFLGGSFEMGGIEVTDKNKPERNLAEVGLVRFQFLWDALLRAKFVVGDASVLDIQALTKRKRPGRVVPPPTEKDGGPGVMQKIEDSVLNQAKSQFNDNLLGDLASVLGGVDPNDQLKAIEGDLKSSLRIKELEKELKEKEVAWRERLKSLPQAKEVEELGQRLKALRFDAKNPVEFAKSVKEADKILKEADQKVKTVKETGKALNEDTNTYSQAFKDLEKMVDQDLKDMQSRLKIPDVNAGDFTKNMFLRTFQQRLVSVKKYAEVAKQYMPPKRASGEKEADQVVPRARGQGKNFRFPITTGYPLFWLKHAAISSNASSSAEYSGNIKGEIKDVTTDPEYLGKPAIITLQGDFPKQQISGLDFKAVLDHTTETPKETVSLKIGGYPVGEQKLSDSKDVQFIINKATGGLDMKAELSGENLNVNAVNAFTQMEYDIEAKNSILKDVLTKVMAGIPVIDVNARAKGTWNDIDFDLSSNLGDELSRGIKAQVQAKIEEAKGKIRTLIDQKIGKDKQKLTAQFDQVKNQVAGEVNKSQSEIEKAKKTAQSEVDKQKSLGGTKKLEEEGKKLLKKFKIGG